MCGLVVTILLLAALELPGAQSTFVFQAPFWGTTVA